MKKTVSKKDIFSENKKYLESIGAIKDIKTGDYLIRHSYVLCINPYFVKFLSLKELKKYIKSIAKIFKFKLDK